MPDNSSNHPPVVLPVRLSLRANAFDNLEIAVLDIPYLSAINQFVSSLGKVLGSRLHWRHRPPYRLLNNTIAACTPTVVHGFESYRNQDYKYGRRMLAVGRINGRPSLQYPPEEDMAELIRVWIYHWGQSTAIKQYVEGALVDDWTTLTQAVNQPPNTQWRSVSPSAFLENIYAENGLAFNAVPGLLATLIHEKTSVIGREKTEIRWRRAQDEHKSLCVVSQPIPISFVKKAGLYGNEEVEKEGFFTYKLVFRIQLQTGREAPWIYAFLHCQRYVDQPLKYNNRGNDITILAGIYQDRLSDLKPDTTLMRLKATRFTNERADWLEYLPRLLESMEARSLVNPYDIYKSPRSYWYDSSNSSNSNVDDEYYIPYVEGYKNQNRGANAVATGFGLTERSEVINQTCCELLNDVLIPDRYLEPDQIIFKRKPFPLALQSFKDIAQKPVMISKAQAKKKKLATDIESRRQHNAKANEKQRKGRQHLLTDALTKTLKGEKLNILCVYRTEDTKIALHQQIRETFLLNQEDSLPKQVSITDCPIINADLLKPLDVGNLNPVCRYRPIQYQSTSFIETWSETIFSTHRSKREQWKTFIREAKSNVSSEDSCCVALIELPEDPKNKKEFHSDQGIKGAIRAACAQEQVLSQMIHPVALKTEAQAFRNAKDKGRTLNAAQDLIIRQIGILYGEPTEIYQKIGLESSISQSLDVIAFCITETNKDVLYCCAVRLRANGIVDVRLPDVDGWIPYSEVGWKIGQTFSKAQEATRDEENDVNPIKLSKDALNHFLESTLTKHLERPTIALIKAEKWRNKRIGWEQLLTEPLAEKLNVLEFKKGRNLHQRKREETCLHNLLSVIRIRTGDETPQYITNRNSWPDDEHAKDLRTLSGFIDITERNVFHYFSIGRIPDTVGKPQSTQKYADPYKIDEGGGISFKHQRLVEMLPFFIRSDFASEEGKKLLCRVPHYLRSSPAWAMGNLVLPLPMHMGDSLLRDHFCILSS